MNSKIIRRAILGLLIILPLSLTGSASTSQLRSDDIPSVFKDDIDLLVGKIKEFLEEENSTYIYCMREEAAKRLRKELSKDSLLYPFPELDEATYNLFITTLKLRRDEMSNKEDETSDGDVEHGDAELLYLWSFVTGIPIVGLKHTEAYYGDCGYLLPRISKSQRSNLKIVPGLRTLCVRVSVSDELGDTHKHYDVSDDMLHSVIVFRSKFHAMNDEGSQEENQKTLYSLLKAELKALSDGIYRDGTRNPLASLLDFLLSIDTRNNGKPCFSFGLVRLFQNTAIYLSTRLGTQSVVINSPCSREGINEFGLQDGIFIERNDCSKKVIARLFGKLFFRRALFKEFPCRCSGCLDALKCTYYPHYTFKMLSDKSREKIRKWRDEGFDQEDVIAMNFADHIVGNKQSLFMRDLISYIDNQQLQTNLFAKSTLEFELFEPGRDVDLSELCNDQQTASDADKESQSELSNDERFALILKHFGCREYSDIRKIDLSRNQLGNRNGNKLGDLLSKNVLPRLTDLDISDNQLSEKVLRSFKKLLERDVFKKLVVKGNQITTAPEDFSSIAKKKLIVS